MNIFAVRQAYGILNASNAPANPLVSKASQTEANNGGWTVSDTTTISPAAREALSTADEIKTQFRNWKQDYLKKGISEDRRQEVEKFSDGFEQIVDKAAANNGYDNPQAFLQSLSGSELETLQHIHCLAAPINPTGLSKEGALNLLLSPDKAQDIDNDGFQMVGLAKGWQFPPVNAPDNVKQAWKETTANMSESDVMLLQGSFLPLSIEGASSNNAYISPDASYSDIVRKVIEGANLSSKYDQPWQVENRQKQISSLETFLSRLQGA